MTDLVRRQVTTWRDSAIASVLRASRITPSALFVRLVVLVAGTGALWIGVFGGRGDAVAWLIAVGGAAVAVVFPGSRYVLAFELVAMLGWLVQTAGLSRPVTWGGLTALAALLYLHHLGCALAAQVSFDTIAPWPMLGRWLLRAVAVIAATGALAYGVVVLVPRLRATESVFVPVLGIVLVGAVLGVLTYLYLYVKRPAGSKDPAGPHEHES